MKRADGGLVDVATGQLLTDSEGRPVRLKPGEKLITGPGGQVYIKQADGRVRDQDGQLVSDSRGRPITLAEGEELIVGSDGQIFTRKKHLLTAHAINQHLQHN